jgi:hypothetical protein
LTFINQLGSIRQCQLKIQLERSPKWSKLGMFGTLAYPKWVQTPFDAPTLSIPSPGFKSNTRSSLVALRMTFSQPSGNWDIAVTAYGVLSRGLLSGHWSKERSETAQDFRKHLPRFSGENLERNLLLVEALGSIAQQQNATVAQVAIAWVLSRGGDIVPLIGSRRRNQLQEALGAVELHLSEDELARIEAAIPPDAVAGDRYDAGQMAMLDSERS